MNRAQKLIAECTCNKADHITPEIEILRKILGSKPTGSKSLIQDPLTGAVTDIIGSTYSVPVVPGDNLNKKNSTSTTAPLVYTTAGPHPFSSSGVLPNG